MSFTTCSNKDNNLSLMHFEHVKINIIFIACVLLSGSVLMLSIQVRHARYSISSLHTTSYKEFKFVYNWGPASLQK